VVALAAIDADETIQSTSISGVLGIEGEPTSSAGLGLILYGTSLPARTPPSAPANSTSPFDGDPVPGQWSFHRIDRRARDAPHGHLRRPSRARSWARRSRHLHRW